MKKRFLLVLTLLFLPLTGSRPIAKPAVRLLQEAKIDFYGPDSNAVIHYRDPEKLQELLNCLRLTRPHGRVEPSQMNADGHFCRIRLYYSTGAVETRYLQDYRFLSTDGTLWQKIPANTSYYLYLLFHLVPGDS